MKSIRTKLLLAFSVVIMLMVIISIILIKNEINVQREYRTLSSNILFETELDYATNEILDTISGIVDRIKSEEIDHIVKESSDIVVIFGHLDKNMINEESLIIYQKLKNQILDFQGTISEMIYSFENNNYVEGQRLKERAFIQWSLAKKNLDKLIFAEIDYLYETQKALTKQSNQSFFSSFILLAFSTLVSGIFVLVFSNSIRYKIRNLLHVTKEIANGNYDVKPISTTDRDEIGELMYSVEIMRQKQKKNTEELTQLNLELEDRVQKRTSELEESNEELSTQKESLILLNQKLQDSLERIKETQNQLIESEKMASLNYLVSGIAHEINTPLGISITAISYGKRTLDGIEKDLLMNQLKRDVLLEDLREMREIFDSIDRCQYQTKMLVDNFKEIAVVNKNSNVEEFLIEDMFESVLLNLKSKLDINRVDVELSCYKGRIITDQGKLSVILTNLISNSLEHGFDGLEKGKITICMIKESDRLILNYKDDGIGVDEEILKHMFEPFFSTKFSGSKSGLGLLTTYNIIKHYFNGTLKYESNPGDGLAYYITFALNELTLMQD